MQCSFGFNNDADQTPRLQLPELAGGALLDVGIYVVQARRAGATDRPRPPVILWACLPACIRLRRLFAGNNGRREVIRHPLIPALRDTWASASAPAV